MKMPLPGRKHTSSRSAAIAEATLFKRVIKRITRIDFDHEQTGVLYRALEELGLHLVPGAYDERGHGTIHVPASQVERLRDRLAELTHSGIDLSVGDAVIE